HRSGPGSGVIDVAAVVGSPGQIRDLGVGEATCSQNTEPGCYSILPVGPHGPTGGGAVVTQGEHSRVELNVPPQIEALGDVPQVIEDLRLGAITRPPAPILLEFRGKRVAVVDAFDVASRTRIPVPVPGPAHVWCGLEHPHGEICRS